MPAVPRVDRIKVIYTVAKALNDGYRVYVVPRVPPLSRVGAFIPAVHRLTVQFDPLADGSAGTRTFIKEKLAETAAATPSVAFYALPSRQKEALLTAEYVDGKQVKHVVDGRRADEVARFAALLLSRSGDPVCKMTTRQSSRVPSIQGQWRPSFHRHQHSSHTPPATQFFIQSVNPAAVDPS